MEWINYISNNDSEIYNICIKDSNLILDIKLWNENIKKLTFCDYYAFKEKDSIGVEIGDIIIQPSSLLLEEVKQDVIDGNGKVESIKNVKSIMFYDAWNEMIILEVIAQNIEFE